MNQNKASFTLLIYSFDLWLPFFLYRSNQRKFPLPKMAPQSNATKTLKLCHPRSGKSIRNHFANYFACSLTSFSSVKTENELSRRASECIKKQLSSGKRYRYQQVRERRRMVGDPIKAVKYCQSSLFPFGTRGQMNDDEFVPVVLLVPNQPITTGQLGSESSNKLASLS